MRVSRSIIIPSITYRFPIRPPAHRGPRMVARPPTERRTPWLKPARTKHNNTQSLDSAQSFEYLNSDNMWHLQTWVLHVFSRSHHSFSSVSFCILSQGNYLCFSPCVFSAVTLEKRDTWDTATKGSPSNCRNTPMMNSINSNAKPPDQKTSNREWK